MYMSAARNSLARPERRARRVGTGAEAEVENGAHVDETDAQIIRLLCADGRASNVKIAKTIGVTETTVRKRIARLLSTGAIEVVAIPSPALAGLGIAAIIGISVELKHIQQVCQRIAAIPGVRYCGYSTGRYDLIIEVFFADRADVLTFITEVLGSMEGIIDAEVSLILKIEKFSFDWEGPYPAGPPPE
jgi:Lrp/AsnC family transcriptional regulator for asnA, asnC and gidA